jgi:beta-hydroxylase
MLKPKTILHCHTHDEIGEENLLQFHLTLTSAVKNNFSYLNVNGEFRQHNVGEAIIFDGSLPHFALNESEHNRVILYLEFTKDLMYKN